VPFKITGTGDRFRFDGGGVGSANRDMCLARQALLTSMLFGAFYSVLSRSVDWCSMTLCSPTSLSHSSVLEAF
jgi:hypothetical protein